MKNTKTNKKREKRSAEEWVLIARHFGEECVKIQRDSNISHDQKLEKQRALSQKMAKEIQEDEYLSESDKRQMIKSIENYMEEWKVIHDKF